MTSPLVSGQLNWWTTDRSRSNRLLKSMKYRPVGLWYVLLRKYTIVKDWVNAKVKDAFQTGVSRPKIVLFITGSGN